MRASLRWLAIAAILFPAVFALTQSYSQEKHSRTTNPPASQQDLQSLRDLVEAQQKQIEMQREEMHRMQDQLQQVLDSVQQANSNAQKLQSGADRPKPPPRRPNSPHRKRVVWPLTLRQWPPKRTQLSPTQIRLSLRIAGVENNLKKVGPFAFSGDFRLRDEPFFGGPADQSQVRNRERFRLRFNANAKLNDDINGGFTLASGDINDPISTNQTTNQFFTRKAIAIDKAFINYNPHQFKPLTLTGGKFAYPWYNTELTWDKDLQPGRRRSNARLQSGIGPGPKADCASWLRVALQRSRGNDPHEQEYPPERGLWRPAADVMAACRLAQTQRL